MGLSTIAAIAPGGASFALATPDGHLEVRRWSDTSLLPIHNGCFGAASIAYSLDGTLFAAANSLGATVWRVSDGAPLTTIPQLANATAIAVSNDGSVVAGRRGGIVVSRPAGILTISISTIGMFGNIGLSPDGSQVACIYEQKNSSMAFPHAYFDGIWRVSDGQQTWSQAAGYGYMDVTPAAFFSPDGTLVAFGFGGSDSLPVIVKASDGSHVTSTDTSQPMMFSADSASVLAVPLQITDLEIYTVSTGTVANTFTFSWPMGVIPQYIAAGFGTGLTAISLVEATASSSYPITYVLELFTDATQTGSVPLD